MAESEVIRSLFVTLRRSTAGKPQFQRRIVEALGLSRPHECVEKPNNASIRGMLMKVPHMVIVETDKMKYLNMMNEYYHDLCRPPVAINHGFPNIPISPLKMTAHTKQQLSEHVEANKQLRGFIENYVPKPPIKYLRERAVRERVRALTEHGLYSEEVKKINERDIALKLKWTRRKQSLKNTSPLEIESR
ncbi:hypothetical protein CEUSTIGMA_g3173.t1 [Chlamydomonas eustigma]|uniref:Large ribosomal subunit protein uL30m n=1 Tax=Chlamydomonas eustigma TaxID=1157962 RepID=A0A250WYZ8_9CHLO|nr:hypothetical protein CEUSTIGMA_g3173.t1 [Chlamydomonas eustigma]|eukprot:GAX75730.1 hypothetical protein CEUSTIGMA_g3173.t1 [Chlamydomonas eustigma]